MANASSGDVTISTTLVGTDATLSASSTISTLSFKWSNNSSSISATGTNGSNACSGAAPTFTGSFAISNAHSTEANNIATAINLCNAAAGIIACTQSVSATGCTAPASASDVTVTARTAGTGGNTISLGETLTGFAWNGSMTGGSDGTNTGAFFPHWTVNQQATDAQMAAYLVAAINRSGNGSSVGVSATQGTSPNTNQVIVSATTAGLAGDNISVSKTLSGFSWANPTLVGGTDSGACGAGNPTVMWGYQTTTGSGAILTSPSLSLLGDRLAYMESAANSTILHVLRPKSGQGTGTPPALPATPHVSTSDGGTWSGCLADSSKSCLFNLEFGSSGDTLSSLFVNYSTDDGYAGNNAGLLYKFTNVLTGTPALAGGSWPVSVNPGHKLTGPVFDSGTSNVIVGDDTGTVSFVHDAGGGSATLGGNVISGLTNITDPAIVDSTTGKAFIFTGAGPSNANVVQAPTDLSSQVSVNVGHKSATQVHAGTFDNSYLNNPFNGSSNSGFLYVCGKATTTDNPVLYRIGFDANGLMSGATDGSSLLLTTNTTAAECSPLTEIFNPNVGPGTDWLFAGVPANCAFGGDAGGCMMSFNVTSTFPATAASTGPETGGTSGIIVDNVSAFGQARAFTWAH